MDPSGRDESLLPRVRAVSSGITADGRPISRLLVASPPVKWVKSVISSIDESQNVETLHAIDGPPTYGDRGVFVQWGSKVEMRNSTRSQAG